MTWQWWCRDFDAQWYRRSDRRSIPADDKKTSVYVDLRVGGWLMMWEGSFGGLGGDRRLGPSAGCTVRDRRGWFGGREEV